MTDREKARDLGNQSAALARVRAGGDTVSDRESLLAALRYEADTSEKALDFMDDEDLVRETQENIALLRQAADALTSLGSAVQRFVAYADEYPQDISGPLADDFLPMLRRAYEATNV